MFIVRKGRRIPLEEATLEQAALEYQELESDDPDYESKTVVLQNGVEYRLSRSELFASAEELEAVRFRDMIAARVEEEVGQYIWSEDLRARAVSSAANEYKELQIIGCEPVVCDEFAIRAAKRTIDEAMCRGLDAGVAAEEFCATNAILPNL